MIAKVQSFLEIHERIGFILTFLLAENGLREKNYFGDRKFSILVRFVESTGVQRGMFFNGILKKVNRQFARSKLTVYYVVKRRFALRKASISEIKTVVLLCSFLKNQKPLSSY